MSMMNSFQWSQDKALRQWMRNSRLDAFGKMASEVDKADVDRQAILGSLHANSKAAMMNIPKLLEPSQRSASP
jgi:hypothetical protein